MNTTRRARLWACLGAVVSGVVALVARAAAAPAAGTGAGPAPSPGRIVVVDDEWVLTDTGLALNPEGDLFARNVADWFTGGVPSSFLVYSHHPGLAGAGLAQTMASMGHSWTVMTVPVVFDLALAQGYDAVFLGGVPVDNTALIQYVQGGGNVYLMAGTAWAPSAAAEAAYWNSFLAAFGLAYDTVYNGIGNFPVPVSSTHPVLAGVTGLYHSSGQSVLDLDPTDSESTILATYQGQGIVAVYEPSVALVSTYCPPKPNSQGCVPPVSWTGTPSASSGSGFTLSATALLNRTRGRLLYSVAGAASIPFRGATLCIQTPIQKTPRRKTGGNKHGFDCSGSLSVDFNAWLASQGGLPAGTSVNAQFWYRDKAAAVGLGQTETGLSEAVQFTLGP